MARRLIPALALAFALLALAPLAASAALPPGFIGVSPQSPTNQRDYRLMREAGVRSMRLPMIWAGIQAKAPAVAATNWSNFDHDVQLAAEEGIRIMPFVTASPEWVAGDPLVLPVHTPLQRRAWAGFLREAAERYGPEGSFWLAHPKLPDLTIRNWEIWNEENIVTFARPDPVGFAKLLRIAGKVLHGIDPGSKVIIGGLFGRPLQIPPNIGSGDFLNRMYDAGNLKRYFDGVALHPYVADVRAMAGQLKNLRRIMLAHGDAHTPLYVTELGWGSRSGPSRWERGLWGQANQLSRAFALLSTNRIRWNIGGAWWYTWSDEGGMCQFCGSAGLLNEKREAKPAWYRFVNWTGGNPDIVPRAPGGE